jgi:hypothetical protein
MHLRIVKCQLGLFGYPSKKITVTPEPSVASDLEDAIRKQMKNGCLPCINAWRIAEEFKMHKIQLGAACDQLKVKIKPCQLGAF